MLVFLRHAHTDFNGPPKRFQGRLDVEISEKGRRETALLCRKLSWDYQRVYSSPAKRCLQTLDILQREAGMPRETTIDHDLQEIDNGWFAGLLESEVAEKDRDHFETWKSYPSSTPAGGKETVLDIRDRVIKFLYRAESISSKGCLILTHGGPIRVLKLLLSGKSLDDFHKINVRNLEFIRLEDSSVEKILYKNS